MCLMLLVFIGSFVLILAWPLVEVPAVEENSLSVFLKTRMPRAADLIA